MTNRLKGGRCQSFLLANLFTGIVLAGLCYLFYSWRDPNFLLTSFNATPPVPPLYVFFIPQFSFYIVLPILMIVGGKFLEERLTAQREWLYIVYLIFLAIIVRLTVHMVRGGPLLPGYELTIYPGEEAIFDVKFLYSQGIKGFLNQYTTLQPELSLHGRVKPPGFAIFHYVLFKVFGASITVTAVVMTIISSVIVLPSYLLGKTLRGRFEDGRNCALFVAVIPSAVIFGSASLDGVYGVVSTFVFLLVLKEMAEPETKTQIGLGLLLFTAMFLSYSTFIVGLFVFIGLLISHWKRGFYRLFKSFAIIATSLFLPYIVIFFLTGFNGWYSFHKATSLNHSLMTGVTGKPINGFSIWAYTSLGNLLAFLVYTGVPVIVGWFYLIGSKTEGTVKEVAATFFLTLLIASFAGIYLMETERIFLFFVPLAALLALIFHKHNERTGYFILAGQTVLLEALFFTLW